MDEDRKERYGIRKLGFVRAGDEIREGFRSRDEEEEGIAEKDRCLMREKEEMKDLRRRSAMEGESKLQKIRVLERE